MAEAGPVLRIEGVCKSYNVGTSYEVEVLHDVDLELERGEFVALIGPSGSGKSTLLNIIGLLDRPTRGRVVVDGHDTGRLDEAGLTRLRGHSIGFVFQYHYLITAFTALENVMMPLLVAHGFPDAAIRRRAAGLLAQVGLAAWAQNPANAMSGGQQQRVAIARALAMQPPLVLADEPTGNLDGATADAVFELMQDVNRTRGTAFLVVTHTLELARRCQRIVQVVDGRIVAATAARATA